MNVQLVQLDNLPSVLKIFKKVKKDLKNQNNDQWKWIYPNRSNYKADIKNGTMHGITDGNELIAVVSLDEMQSQQYQTLNWNDQKGKPYCIHRLAVNPSHQGKGLGKFLLQYIENFAIEKGYTSVRIDVYKINETAHTSGLFGPRSARGNSRKLSSGEQPSNPNCVAVGF
ncbi:GNAT family N-acetyltransferase [Paenibacillus sabinae]|uniref:GCN5-like N-acetyltransferase n=1 Tax=Paenibacillus sabinae T27 TaxID=1268072 RepID=X5A3D3_9BACL|nr:GNAT family N-acetyltransferase [Paenibacillus sabinae]AHV98813.1 GCN5-like N-acetyltransferase [Paenibacillus sabinae T27]